MTGHILGIVALVAVVGAGGTVWVLVRDDHGRSRESSAFVLRWLGASSAVVVLVTTMFLRPWYWDVAIAGAVAAGLAGVHRLLAVLVQRPSPAGWRSIAAAMASVVVGSGLVTLGGASVVVDGAALAGGRPAPAAHAGQVLDRPVLYQVFWGPVWDSTPGPPALAQAVAFQRGLPTSRWGAAVVHAGFGVRAFADGGCWIDPGPPTEPGAASSTAVGVFPDEVHLVLAGHRHLLPCPGAPAVALPSVLPRDALVALWLDPAVPYELGGVSVHGSVPWAGRPDGLAVTGLSGGFASWGLSSCRARPACRAVPAYVSPAYALSHEVVEATVNPYGRGWFADVPLQWAARYVLAHGPTSMLGALPAFEGEVADLCEPGQPDAPRPGSSGTGTAHAPTLASFYRPGGGCTT
ncbi:MAG TPA: hypothetical protein VMV22_14110 [Acidimicrobiales bacterium]|nr:hypothetical protein [Acidimicrobiales bacterium]